MEKEIVLPHRFIIRPYQRPVARALASGINRLITVWHRRAGKDLTWLNLTIDQMVARVGSYYHVLPTFKQAKKILWDGIEADGTPFLAHFPPELVADTNEVEMQIKLKNGSIWQLVASDTVDGDAMVGTNPVGIVFSEFSIQSPALWNKMRPVLAENGGWAGFAYTPRGHNHGWDLYEMAKKNPKWFAELLTIADTTRGLNEKYKAGEPVVTREDYLAELEAGMDEDLAQQEFYCSFEGSQQGNYYAKWISELKAKGQVSRVPYDPLLPVHTFWDLGVDDHTCVWFMQALRQSEYRFIDYYEAGGYGLQHYVQELRKRDYVYGDHYFPHDTAVRELGTGKSRLEVLRSLGMTRITVGKALPVKDGIDAARSLLPLCWFDKEKTEAGLNALISYKRDYDERNRKFKDKPLHDWASHPADAFREFAVNYKEKKAATQRRSREFYGEGSWMR